MTLKRLACGLASIGVLATGCTQPAPVPDSLVIGVLTSSAGDSALSDEAERGARLAIEIVNDSHPSLAIPLGPGSGLPRLAGAKLSIASSDATERPDLAAAQASELVSQRHVAGLVVTGSAAVAAAVASETQRLRIPVIDAYNTADYLTELGMEWYFRTGPADRLLAESAFALLRGHPSRTAKLEIALVTEAGTDTVAGLAHLRDIAARTGSNVLLQHEITAGAGQTGALADRLSNTPPSAIFAWAHTAAGAEAISGAVAAVSGSLPLVGLGPGFRHLAKPAAAPGLMRAVTWSAELARRSPAAKAVMALYEARYSKQMTEVAAATFMAVIALAASIDAAGSADPAAIRSALKQTALTPTQMIMPWNGLQFGPDGQNQLAATVVEAWDSNGFRVVHPAEVASGPVPWGKGSRP